MAKYRMVHTEFWDDPKVVEEMTPEDKFFFLYLLTNSNTTQIGIYQVTKKQMAFDMGYSIESVKALLQRFRDHHRLVRYNEETRELAIKNWGKYNLAKGGKPIMDCIKAELKEVKDLSLIQYVAEHIQKPDVRSLYDSYHDTSTIRGQKEKEKEKEKEKQQHQEPEQKPAVADAGKAFRFYEDNISPLVPHIAERISIMIDESSEELVHEALKRSVEANARNKMNFSDTILSSWKSQGITTLDGVLAADKEFERRKRGNANGTTSKNHGGPDDEEWDGFSL